MPERSEVLEGWASLAIQDVCDINPPKPKKGDVPDDTPVTFVPMPAVDAERGKINSPEVRQFSKVRGGYTAFRDGDVIIAKITPCMENGKAAVAHQLVNGLGFGSTEFFVLRSNGSMLPRYLFHYVRQKSFREQAESKMTGSVGQKRVPKEFVKNAVIPLPPLAEQHRIVAAIEALFARLDAANARLERVPGILKQFRQSVLATACDGRLTEDWRKSDQDCYESSLIKCTVGEILAEKMVNGRSVRSKENGFPVLRLSAVRDGRIDPAHRKNGAWTQEEASNFLIRYGDFLVVRGNGSLELVGRGGLVGYDPEPIAFPDTLIRIRLKRDIINAHWFSLVWNSPVTRKQIEKLAHTTAGIHKISQQDIAQVSITVPSIEEQHEIVRRVDALFTLADRIEAKVAAAREKTETMRQSILAQAFSGRLVPTEAELARQEGRAYEPASVLLERIRSEKKEKKGRKGVQSTLV
ncbi:restriction endonuclease subunit S [Methanoculleus bourgensis]|uniref:restriction endonuclease subunit S n=1 Tax=Methanoculleus bourgensis TaxID=83986 RepID=UPI0024905CBF|nr:restriction endonuclease subunit S [Methanoculleus bourgensis]